MSWVGGYPLAGFEVTIIGRFWVTAEDLGLELVALRHQLAVLKRENPRTRLSGWDRLFWLTFRRLWPKWSGVLLIVKPETVVGAIAPAFGGTGALFLAMAPAYRESPRASDPWPRRIRPGGAPRIYGELLKLGFEILEARCRGTFLKWPRLETPAGAG
jgi:hypothetical protein